MTTDPTEEQTEALGSEQERVTRAIISSAEALRQAAVWFRDYESQHLAKGTPDGDAKAKINADRAASCEAAADAALSPQARPVLEREALREIAAERQRQIEVEGWTPEHDDAHDGAEMAKAAACYAAGVAIWRQKDHSATRFERLWPWDWKWWKPQDRRRNLVKAAALIVAEIERLDRLALTQSTRGGENDPGRPVPRHGSGPASVKSGATPHEGIPAARPTETRGGEG